jgi:peptidoglycan hydrolase CwlO-like protein
MKIKRVGITILVLLFSFVCFIGLSGYYEKQVFAEISCPYPDSYSEECLKYMEEELEKLEKEKGLVQKKLKDEEYQQLSLQERITYINNQIAQTETTIKTLEIEIASHDIEIRLLEKNIQEKEDNLSVLGQEISVLEETVGRRVSESYKYSFISPLELFLDFKNFDSLLRKTKYLAVTRTQDRDYLKVYGIKVQEVKTQESKLADNKAELQTKRNLMEEEKLNLSETKSDLANQKTERERLLAESKAKEATLAAELNKLSKESNEVTAIIQTIVLNRYRSGLIPVDRKVEAGDIIGYQGHTGFAYGSHLHFNLSGVGTGPLELGYFKIDNGRIYDGIAKAPLGNGSYLSYGYHFGYSLDMYGNYNLNNQKYTLQQGEACCPLYLIPSYERGRLCDPNVSNQCCVRPGQYNLNGEGSPVYALKAGVVTTVQKDPCGANYVVIDHGGGELSLYLHLR